MNKILGVLIILTIIDPGSTGDKELEARDKNVHEPSGSSSIRLTDLNRTTMDAYHKTDPYTLGHERRMTEWLHDPKTRNSRQRAIRLIEKLCKEWCQITGLNQSETRKLLDEIYLTIKTNGPDLLSLMRNKLLEIRPDLMGIDPEIIRSVVHNWYKSIKRGEDCILQLPVAVGLGLPTEIFNIDFDFNEIITEEGRIGSREGEADLLYTLNQIKYGKGHIYDRLANKWKQFHPDMSNYHNFPLIKKAYNLSKARGMFTPEEMEAARMRYESVFGSEDAGAISRMKWSDEQANDLLYLTSLYKRKKISLENLHHSWQIMYPELASIKSKSMVNKRSALKRKKFKERLTPEEEVAAASRLEAALAKIGGSEAIQRFQEHEVHQREPEGTFHFSPAHSDYDFNDNDWELLNMMVNEETSSHPPIPRPSQSSHYGSNNLTTPNQDPFGISHSHFEPFTHQSYTANPYYEKGDSSHSHYNPNTSNPYYEHGNSSYPLFRSFTANPYHDYGNSSHSHDKPNPP